MRVPLHSFSPFLTSFPGLADLVPTFPGLFLHVRTCILHDGAVSHKGLETGSWRRVKKIFDMTVVCGLTKGHNASIDLCYG